MRAKIRAAVLVVLAAWAFPAHAQVDAAAAFRQTIEGWLAALDARSGAIAVRIDGAAAVATVPDVVVTVPEAVLRLGTLTITRRDVADGRQRYELPLPREVRLEGQGERGTLTIADGAFAAVVDPQTGTIHAEEGRAAGLVLQFDGEQDRITIAGVELAAAIVARADGLSDLPTRLRGQNLRVEMPSVGVTLSLGELAATADVQGFRLADYERLRDATESAIRSGATQSALQLVEQWLAFAFASVPLEIAIADFTYADGGAEPAVAIARAAWAQVIESLAAPQTGLRIRYAHEGVSVRGDMMPYVGLVPADMRFDLAISGIPSEELRDILSNGVANGAIALDSFWMDAFDALLVAGIDNRATVRVAPLEWSSPLLGIAASAVMTGDDRSPLSMVGNGEIVIRGIEEALRAILGDPQQAGAASPAAIGAIIAAIGQQGTDAAGRPTRSYRFAVDADGRLTLNGTDLSALLGGAPPPQPAQPGK